MKVKIHMRVAKQPPGRGRTPFQVSASAKPNYEALKDGRGNALPTAMFAMNLDIPDEIFQAAEIALVALPVPYEKARVAVRIEEEPCE